MGRRLQYSPSVDRRVRFPNGQRDREAGDTAPTGPNWLTDDTAIGSAPDKQILVVGDSVAGLVLTGLLQRAGFDPICLGATSGIESRLTYLWPSALRLFAALGLREVIREHGYAVESVSIERRDSRRPDATTSVTERQLISGMPVVGRTRDLRRVLLDRLFDERAYQDRHVGTLTEHTNALEIRFDDGVREWFDAVVDVSADGTSLGRADSRAENVRSMRQYEQSVKLDGSIRKTVWSVWHADAFVEVVPEPSAPRALLRVTTVRSDRPAELRDSDWDVFLPEDLCGCVTGGEPSVRESEQGTGQPTSVATDWWAEGRLARCGLAGFPVAPASGLQSTLAVEDARTLATELVRCPRSVTEAIETYAGRRHRRLTGLLREGTAVRSDGRYFSPSSRDLSPPLATIARLRAAALDRFDAAE